MRKIVSVSVGAALLAGGFLMGSAGSAPLEVDLPAVVPDVSLIEGHLAGFADLCVQMNGEMMQGRCRIQPVTDAGTW